MRQFDKVILLTDKYVSEGIKKGDIGVILEDHVQGYYLVDFSDQNGITIVLDSFPEEELELAQRSRGSATTSSSARQRRQGRRLLWRIRRGRRR